MPVTNNHIYLGMLTDGNSLLIFHGRSIVRVSFFLWKYLFILHYGMAGEQVRLEGLIKCLVQGEGRIRFASFSLYLFVYIVSFL